MKKLMTRRFAKWASKQKVASGELLKALNEVERGHFETNLGGHIFKKHIRFRGKGKRGSGRTIICYKRDDRAIFIHGFAKNEKSNLSPKELIAFKELAKVLLGLSIDELNRAVKSGTLIEVTE